MTLKNISKLTTPLAIMLISLNVNAMSESEARTLVQPFYNFLSAPNNLEVAAKAKQTFSPSWKSYSSENNYKGLDATFKKISHIGKTVPNLKWDIKNVSVSGNLITVRSEASGTPVAPLFGIATTGKSFKVMAIDVHHTSDAGKIETSYHVEDWAGAMRQLKAK